MLEGAEGLSVQAGGFLIRERGERLVAREPVVPDRLGVIAPGAGFEVMVRQLGKMRLEVALEDCFDRSCDTPVCLGSPGGCKVFVEGISKERVRKPHPRGPLG